MRKTGIYKGSFGFYSCHPNDIHINTKLYTLNDIRTHTWSYISVTIEKV